MKLFIILATLFLTISTFANGYDCREIASKRILKQASKELKIDSQRLKIRYIGGEYLNGGVDHGHFMDQMEEYFDIFFISQNSSKDTALSMYSVEVYTYGYEVTKEVLGCEFENYKKLDQTNWQKIYNKYL